MFLKKLDQHLLDALEEFGFETPTKVQKQSISKIKSGVDLMIRGDEKSGRSSTIVISVIQQLKNEFEDVPRALIIVSSREKSIEMKELFQELGQNTDLRVFCEGDAGNLHDLRDKIYAGSDVVIATAKKLNELYSFSGINLNNLKMFIIDDGELIMRDQILSEINRLAPYIPKSQRIVFCERFTVQMDKFMDENMNFPTILDIKSE
ncbi:DEAD/DEAH box helicase [Marinifilum sp. D737]|uniref:DEAD/DEAH box helicase n=1 Tax=Marinifilum sp. D737 TaxID=2969628 RepID=UPI002276E0AA|nr:DEAD/DEAH box helicase [Marinifilum sp. D737]MCY1635624.1 DEAD/DEAH box helicase [Marinifilum sp. D737]